MTEFKYHPCNIKFILHVFYSQMVSLDSTVESTGLYEGRITQKSQSSYDENDEEVAEVLGEEYTEDQPMSTQPFDKMEV